MANLLERPLGKVLEELVGAIFLGAFAAVLFWLVGRVVVYFVGSLLRGMGNLVANLGGALVDLAEWSNRLRGNDELYAMATLGLVFAGIFLLLMWRKPQ